MSHSPFSYSYLDNVQVTQAAKDVGASYDALIDLFESIENFLSRLNIYAKIPQTPVMTEIIVKITVELLSTLAVATKQIKQGRPSKSESVLVYAPLVST
jgi:hypothetical protein